MDSPLRALAFVLALLVAGPGERGLGALGRHGRSGREALRWVREDFPR